MVLQPLSVSVRYSGCIKHYHSVYAPLFCNNPNQ
jgi:hypothetical protein